MDVIPTIFELAYAKLTAPERYVDIVRRVDPGCIPHLAEKHLARRGAKLVGDPGLVAFAREKAVEEVEAILTQLANPTLPRKTGRPIAEPERDFILAAAFYLSRRTGLALTEARQHAARFLGPPITKDQVEKATARFLERSWKALRPFSSATEVWSRSALILHDVVNLLQECEAERDRRRGERCLRRKALPIVDI